MRLGVIGSNREGLPVAADRLLESTLLAKGGAEIVLSLGEVRIERERPAIAAECPFQIAELSQRIAEIVMGLGDVGIDGKSLADMLHCPVIFSGLKENEAEKIRGFEMIGILTQDPSVEGLGFRKAARPMMPHRQRDGFPMGREGSPFAPFFCRASSLSSIHRLELSR